MDAVKEFNAELCSLYEIQPPVTKAKMSQITKTAIKALKFYKHVVQSVEKFIQKCRQEYKVPGLYIIDSIIRCSRKQFGPNKDMFAPRFSKNIVITFHNLFDCPPEDISKMIRVLNLWQKNGVYHPGIIQPLLDLASDPHNPAVFETVQKQVEQVTGLTPSMPLKCDQKPPALTADALQLGSGLDLKSDLQGDFSKVVNQLMQSMIPNPVPSLSLNPQMHLQLLQQLLQLPVPMVPSAPLLQNNMRLPSSSTVDSSLIGQIQMLTQQLLNQTAPIPAGQLTGLNASYDGQFKQPIEAAVEMEPFDDNYHEDLGEMSSLDKRIMYMCGEGEAKDETDVSHQRSLGDNDRSRKHSQSKRSTQAEFEERNVSEAGYGSDVANPSGTPNTPGHSSSLRSSPRRSSNYNDVHGDDEDNVGYGRTPSSCLNMNNEEEEDELHNGSEMENDSESRCSNGDFRSRSRRRSESSQRSHKSRESKSKKSKRHEEEDREDSRRSRKSKHKSRSDERSSKHNKSSAVSTSDGRSDRSKHKKRSKHDSQNMEQMERRISKDDSRASEGLKAKEASGKKHSSRTASSPERKRRKTEFTVEYGIDEDDDEDDDVIFVDIQKKSVDVSRFLEKKLPSLKPKRKRASRSSSRGSSVEFISQDTNSEKPNKAKEFMPPSKPNMMSVCSTTLWIGHLNKLISEEELRAEIMEFGEVTINLVPPRGCAFITFSSRAEAHKALDHLKNVSVQGNQLKVAWAAGVGIKNSPYYEKYDIDHGVTYIQWSEISSLDLPQLLDGSFIDEDSLPPNFDRGTLTTKKSKKKKTQQQDVDSTADATAINPSLIPLPQAVPPISSLPPPPLPPITSTSVSNSTQSLNVSLTHPPHGINSGMPPLPPPTTCYVLPPGSANSSSVNDNLSNNLSSPMGLLKGMPHFDPSIPPPCLPPGMPPLPGSDNMPSNHHAVPFMPPTSLPTADMMMRRIEIPPPVAQTSSEAQTNHSLFSHMDSISHIPVVIHSHHDSNIIHQNSVPNSRTFMNSAILQGHSLNSNSLRIEKSQLPTTTSVLPISASSILHPPPQVILMEKPQVNLLSTQHNFLIRQPHENKLTMPGSVLRPFRPEVGPAVGDLTDQQQESTNNGNLVSGQRPQRPRDVVVQQNLILPPHVMSVNQLRPNLYQPPPSSSLTNSMNHQESVKRLPVPSEFLRRLGASTTSAPPQSNTTDNNASKQTPLLPIPQVNVPPPSLQVQSLSSLGGGPAQDGLVNIPPTSSMQNNEPQACSSLQDSKPPRKQPLLETPVTPKDNSFNSQLLHPSQMLNMNHPAYNSLDHQKKDQNMPPPQMLNAMGDRFKTPRPPRLGLQGEQFECPENQQLNVPIILNFANPSSSSVTEALITEAIKSLSPLVRIPNPQECMGLLRSPLMNPASFLTGPHVLGNPRLDLRMHLRSPGMRGPNNFKMGDRRNLLRPSGLNHQRSPLLRQRFPHNQQQ